MKRLGYADPPYVGCCALYGHYHPDGKCWDAIDTTFQLLDRLNAEFDGWVLCLKSDAAELSALIQRAGPGVRVGAWVKPFASFKPNVNPGFCWEPVLFKVGKRDRYEPTVRDFCSANITMQKGLPGAKPLEFNRWVLGLLGAKPGDEVVDLFPGTGGMATALAELTPVCSNAACTVPRHAGPCTVFAIEAEANYTPTVPSGMQGIQRGGTAKSASNDGPSGPEGGEGQ